MRCLCFFDKKEKTLEEKLKLFKITELRYNTLQNAGINDKLLTKLIDKGVDLNRNKTLKLKNNKKVNT